MFVVTVREEQDDSFPRSIIENAFKDYVDDTADDYWNLRDADGDQRFVNMDVDQGERISSFSINRPPDYETFPQFWEALFEVLRQTKTVLFWPGDPPHPIWCIANQNFLGDLPALMIDDMGKPAIVHSGLEIVEALERTNRHFR